MRTQKFTLSILAFSLFTCLPFIHQAQVDFGKFNVFDDEIVEDIQLTDDQVRQITELESNCGVHLDC